MSPRVSDERPEISLAKSFTVNLPAFTGLAYHFFGAAASLGFTFSTNLNYITILFFLSVWLIN